MQDLWTTSLCDCEGGASIHFKPSQNLPSLSLATTPKYTSCKAFLSTLNEMNDYAGQHEVISENMTSQITMDLARYVQELKQERKSNFHDGRKAQQHIETCWKQLESSKRRFERDCKEADRAQQYFEKMDADINVTKADVEKARQQAQIRHQMAEDSKADYSSILQKFNQEQHEYYHTHIPNIFQKIQEMEERRIVKIGESMKTYAEVDRQVIPIIGKCLDGIVKAAESIDQKNSPKQQKEPLSHRFNEFMTSKPKIHCFRSLKRGGATPEDFSNLPPEQRRKKLQQKVDELNKEMQKEMDQRDAITKMKDVYLKNPQMGDPASLDHKLTEVSQNIEKLRLEAQKFEAWLAEVEGRLPARSEQARRQSAMYDSQNPPAVNSCAQDRERYSSAQACSGQAQACSVCFSKSWGLGRARTPAGNLLVCHGRPGIVPKVQVFNSMWVVIRAGRMAGMSFQHRWRPEGRPVSPGLVAIVAVCFPFLSSPDGSYTEEQSQESEVKVLATDFDDEFDDEEPLPAIGTCKALYTFEGQNEGTISVAEGETLYVIEEDKGDGWTRIRRSEDEEGYVPTSYVEVYLDKNAKGAKTYI
ncbi:Formin-binding protein 1 [Tupaia chinensis]|uniref:Formin-binding protein 1 n=1 Tax=Tupaia chinensis TaxID=246437 RepID=L8YBP2_TUPCH|nr:Formin-binding protein 1 [Tupaia chinensis]